MRYCNIMLWNIENEIRSIFNLYESEEKLVNDSKEYWSRDYSKDTKIAQDAHWRGKGIFKDEHRWQNLGKEHFDLIYKHASVLNLNFPLRKIIEWGCGGGANAIHFASHTNEFIGIDITLESLVECGRQIENRGLKNFIPILVDPIKPESVLKESIECGDLFLCTYVYELFPTPEYGLKILKIAHGMLITGGVACIQIRYNDCRRKMYSKKWGYKINAYQMTTYTIEEFWNSALETGFEPVSIVLQPKQPLVNEQCYAYYFLKKK